MGDFELTNDEKRQVINQRIKNLQAQRYDLLLNIRLGEEETFKDAPGSAEATAKARTDIKEVEKGIETLQGYLTELDQQETNDAIPLNRANRRAQGKEKEKLG